MGMYPLWHKADRAAARDMLLCILGGVGWLIAVGYLPVSTTASATSRSLLQLAVSGAVIASSLATLIVILRRHSNVFMRLQQTEVVCAAAIKAASDAIAIVDAKGTIRTMSAALASLTGHPLQNYLGRQAWDAVHPEDQLTVRQALAALVVGQRQEARGRLRVLHSRGHWITLECYARPLYGADDTIIGILAVARESCECADLEQRRITVKHAAEKTCTARSEFLAQVSHELRTPLNAILGFAQVLEMEQLPPHQSEAVKQIRQGGAHLLSLLNDILDIAKAETAPFTITCSPIYAGTLVRDVLESMRHIAEQRKIALHVATSEADFQVLADRTRLTQVLLNLVSNAIKYNHPRGSVDIRYYRYDSQWLRIEVRDTGPGIPSEKLERLFLPFERLGADQSGIEGSGLGLTVSRSLIQAMGGEIGVESALGHGSLFWLKVPLAKPPEQVGPGSVPREQAGGERTNSHDLDHSHILTNIPAA